MKKNEKNNEEGNVINIIWKKQWRNENNDNNGRKNEK